MKSTPYPIMMKPDKPSLVIIQAREELTSNSKGLSSAATHYFVGLIAIGLDAFIGLKSRGSNTPSKPSF